jgi:hypothetical protein
LAKLLWRRRFCQEIIKIMQRLRRDFMYFTQWYRQFLILIGVIIGVGLTMAFAQSTFGGQVHGDFNDDGYDDLAVGVPGEDIGAISNAGAVNVLYGSNTGLQATGVGGPNDQVWYQDIAGVQDTSEAYDSFGSSLAIGDFNGDGYDDLAVGVTGEGTIPQINEGAVQVLYGSNIGLQATGVGGPDDQIWYNDRPNDPLSNEVPDLFGYSLGIGDFNNDGYDDLAVGVPNDTVNDIDSAGSVKVLYGSDAGLQDTGIGGPDDQLWHQDIISVLDTAEANDLFGWSLSVGDFDGDGYDDLAVGVRSEGIGNPVISNTGAVNVLYGSNTGLQATGVGGPMDQLWHQNRGSVLDTAEANDLFGWSLSAGDFNGDGYDDLAVGVENEGIGDPVINGAGAVNVLYGSNTGLQATGVGGPNDQLLHQNTGGVLDTAEAFDHFGYSLSVGDFNGDGYDDLAVGVPYENIGAISNAGAVNVLYGSDTGLQATGVGGPNDQLWHQDVAGVQGGAEPDDFFGNSLSVGDFNGDGNDDLTVGVPYENIGNPNINDAGVVQVLYGSNTGLQATGVGGPNDQLWHQDVVSVGGGAEPDDHFGASLGGGRS